MKCVTCVEAASMVVACVSSLLLSGCSGAATTTTTRTVPVFDGPIRAIAVAADGTMYVGGGFLNAGPSAGQMVPRSHLAAIDPQGALTSWNPGAGNNVSAIAIAGSTVYVGGDFVDVGGQERGGLAALDVSGAVLPWNPGFGGTSLSAIAVAGDLVYVGGAFSFVGGQPRSGVAAVDGTGAVTDWAPNPDGAVLAIATGPGVVYVGGTFASVGGQARHSLAAIDPAGLATSWDPACDGAVASIALKGVSVYVGGNFTSIGGQARTNLALLDGLAQATPWAPSPTAGYSYTYVATLALSGEHLLVGGRFGTIAGQSRRDLASFDGANLISGWSPLSNSTVNEIYAVVPVPGGVAIGGTFQLNSGSGPTHLAILPVE